jgi:glycine dehydrogenase subunit 1
VAAVAEPIALGLLKSPGELGADIVAGEGQSFGIPVAFGGPYLGFFAARQQDLRSMPGRLVGETVDKEGRRGFVLTLSTREKHIRREKATSNICTNQGLLALRATIYMGLMGREGMREMADLCVQKTHHAARSATAIPGYSLAHGAAFFREFVLECPVDASAVIAAGRTAGVLPGIDLGRFDARWKHWLLVAVTEQRSAEEIETWLGVLRAAGGAK